MENQNVYNLFIVFFLINSLLGILVFEYLGCIRIGSPMR